MRNGFDPRRRNRNIGTARQGHGADNFLVVPQSWHQDRVFYERLENPVIVHRRLHQRQLTFLVEPPRDDCVHACTVDDIVAVLALLPREHRLLVRTFVLRQPKRKEEILASCWGRLVYAANFGRFAGVTIFLEAHERDQVLRWSTSLSPEAVRELDRLREDGHRIERQRREFQIHTSLEANRNTQLYRTLPHEVGHYVHYLEALKSGEDHWARPSREMEDFAHRYADEFRTEQFGAGRLGFPRRIHPRQMAKDGLRPKWFSASSDSG